MQNEAYCDDCFTYVTREHAEARKPCPKCGNTFYAVADQERLRKTGEYLWHLQREANMRAYYDALEEINAIRITGMTEEDYARYIEAGERNLSFLERCFDEMAENDRRRGREPEFPPVIPMPIKLPDMYMRHGRWDDAQRVYDFCKPIPYLQEFDFERLKAECEENRLCAGDVVELVASGVHSQKAIKKALASKHSKRAMNFVLGYYVGLSRIKDGSDFVVVLAPLWPE